MLKITWAEGRVVSKTTTVETKAVSIHVLGKAKPAENKVITMTRS